MPESIGSDSDQLQKIVRSCFFLRSQKLDPWHFTLVYHDDSTGAVFIEFSPRSIPAP